MSDDHAANEECYEAGILNEFVGSGIFLAQISENFTGMANWVRNV